MARFDVDEIAKATGGRLVLGGGRVTSAVALDSRKVRRGALFIAIKGKSFDGHDFVREAFANGAAAAMVSGGALFEAPAGKTIIHVEDTIRALQDLAAYHRTRFKKLRVVGVTGSNGKTTVKEMIASALVARFNTLKTEGNLNNYIGLPMTLLRLTDRHEAAVVEMGMNEPGEIAMLTRISKPSIGVITNVGPAHIGNFKSIADVRAAKGEMIAAMPANGAIVLNADDANSRPLIDAGRKKLRKVVTFGKSPWADVSLVDSWPNGSLGRWAAVYANGTETKAHVPLLGEHHVLNALAAFAAASLAGVAAEDIARGIGRMKPAPMRMEPVFLSNGALLVNDSYNANPASVAAALAALKQIKRPGRTIFVFGDMKELGAKGEREHRKIGGLAAKTGVDRLYVFGALARLAADEAEKKGVAVTRGASHESIAKRLARTLRPDDTILVKGSRGMEMEKVARLLTAEAGRN